MPRKRANKRKRKINGDTDPRKGKNEDAHTLIEEPTTKTPKLSSQELHNEPNSHLSTRAGNNEKPSHSNLEHGKQDRFAELLSSSRPSPLPEFSWANSEEVWEVMLQKDERHIRRPEMFKQHPALKPEMRAILFDWLMEICQRHHLNRETYYLSVDLIDRYLGQVQNIQVNQLELIGITALFTAAKLEGPYPPKAAVLAFHTDGDVTEEDIFKQEMVMIQTLNWDMCPITSIGWLKLYMEMTSVVPLDTSLPALQHDLLLPKYSPFVFAQIAKLMDLAILDAGCLNFKHSVLAAAAVYHLLPKEMALSVSGLKLEEILPCVTWMTPFADTILNMGPETLKVFPGIAPGECHEVQTFSVSSSTLEEAQGQHASVV